MQVAETEQKIMSLLEPLVEREGYFLLDLELRRQERSTVLTIYLDKAAGGLNSDAMGHLSEEMGRHLDVADLIPGRYTLEVASPGLERVLKKPREFAWFKGRQVSVKLREPRDGISSVEGVLGESDDGGFHLRVGEEEMVFGYDDVKRVQLTFRWGRD
ncbi:MAG: ribosome maturation factor RimP [Candidatus Geothermincolia bacterium]